MCWSPDESDVVFCLKRWPFRTRRNDDHCQFLTPMIEKHAVQSARDASFAKIFKNRANATAYSGFITVNKKQQSNLFFIYMQAEVNRQRAPLMIYLQGGPGKSGTFGQFLEVGPLGVNSEGILYRRSHTVQKMFNVIFLDQPAGSGFSSTKSQMGYARSIDDCVTGMREFLRQFLVLFPENRNRELYVAGESYGSRGAVALAHSLMTNPDRGIPLKVSGVIAASPVFGNALDLLDSADTLYQFGMLDSNGRDMFAQAMHRVRHLWANNRTTALHILSHTIFRLHPTPSLFTNLTSYNDHASLLSDQRPREFIHYNRYMQKPLLKKSLHLCSRAKVDSSRLLVMLYLAGDYDTDLRDKVQYLLDATKMLVFTGQVDTDDSRRKPLLLWLQGGPGKSSLYGQFLETGPLGIDAGGAFYCRRSTLLHNFNIIYLDQPAGAGYSFDKKGDYPATLELATTHGMKFLRRFLRLFEEYRDRDFFIAGESYGGNICILVTLDGTRTQLVMRLAVGDFFVDLTPALVDVLNNVRNDSRQKPLLLWLQGGPGKSSLYGQFLENGPLGIDASGKLFHRRHSLLNYFNIIYLDQPAGAGYSFDRKGHYPSTLDEATTHGVRFLRRFLRIFEEYRDRDFFIAGESYGAQLDSVFPASKMEHLFEKLQWRGSAMFRKAARKPWYKTTTGNAHKTLLGYEKVAGAVMYNTVLFGGHQISFDQSEAVSDLYARFLEFTSMPPPRKCEESKNPC
ncbi:hypothetical protein HPB52_017713 [Rhipicephalus sanguineus]|uniref:Carboxypeptidase n=1 Tax=Rhipicephalus sanguineus TaxID=34632 RepID=A0A9D4T5V3_RHISA|nr:hypothetical protein HPB52_017713 [Rhipicephalus sanguineus]